MVRNYRQKKHRKQQIKFLFTALILAGIIFLFITKPWEHKNNIKTPSDKASSANLEKFPKVKDDESLKTDQEQDNKSSNPDNNQDFDPTHKTPKNIEGEIPDNGKDLTGVITAIRKSQDQKNLIIRTNISQLVNSGTCKLEMTHLENKQQYQKTVRILRNPNSSSCEGFDVPISELIQGKWSISIIFQSENKQGITKAGATI